MGLLDRLKPYLKSVGPRTRRAHGSSERVHVELRALGKDDLERFSERFASAAKDLPGAVWAEVNPHTWRAVVAFDAPTDSQDDVVAIVERVEDELGLSEIGFRDDLPSHPGDHQAATRTELEILADSIGIAIGATLRLSPFRPLGAGVNASALIALVNAVPKLKTVLDEALHPLPTDHLLALLDPIAQGFSQRTLSSIVDLVVRQMKLREERSRRRVWIEREGELSEKPFGGPPEPIGARPAPMPPGPIESYVDSAWMVSLGAFLVSLAASRSARNATASLLAGLPKSARLGREAFGSFLGQTLADRGVLVLDPAALRKLDRVDTVVVAADLLGDEKADPRARYRIGEVVRLADVGGKDLGDVAAMLFDRDHPLETQRRAGWTLGPAFALAPANEAVKDRAREMSQRGALVLGLAEEGRVVALVEVRIAANVGLEELIATARDAKIRVYVAASDAVAFATMADGVVPAGEELAGAIRRLQRDGRVVCAIAPGPSSALAAADVGVGLCKQDEPAPWGADLVCGSDLGDPRFVIAACVAARNVARQSVGVAVAAASLGAFASAGGFFPNARRVMRVVNTASLASMANGVRVAWGLSRAPLPPPRDPTPWHALDPDGAVARLRTTTNGLTVPEVRARTRGKPQQVPAIAELAQAVIAELDNPLSPLLAAGAGLSAVVGSADDALLVAGVVGLNALVGGAQRFQTERAIRRLALANELRARVRRSGNVVDVRASELVRGDVVLLEAGDVVPADCRILDAVSLEVDGSSLTGESLPVAKSAEPSFAAQIADRASMLYEGTSIASGRATAVVVAVGDDTEARRGAAIAGQAPPRGGVEARLEKITSLTAPIAGAAGLGLVALGLLRGRSVDEIVGAGVSMAVAAVPEGLPLLATAAQLAAGKRLAEHGVLVRNPRALEALGRVSVLCVDKTGTVTEGRLRLVCVADGERTSSPDALDPAHAPILAAACRATPPALAVDATDDALLRGASIANVPAAFGAKGWRRSAELTFEAGRRFHAVLGADDDGARLAVKGAPEAIVSRCTGWRHEGTLRPMDDAARLEALGAAARLAEAGLRVLAVAERTELSEGDAIVDEGVAGLVLLGFVAFRDPVRASAPRLVAELKRAGVDVVMITGDHPSTGEAIARELGIARPGAVVTGAQIDRMSDAELDARMPVVSVVARATPTHKARVVRSLQRIGKTVGMAGDGANDVPAIRLADVGIALGEKSTQAARAAADLVITDERIESLVRAVVEGRAMWSSVRDAVGILIGGNVGEIGFTLGAGLVDGRPPLNARQLLVVNLLTDVAPAMAVALRPPASRSMEALATEGPDASLGTALYRDIALRSVLTAAGAGGAWVVGRLTGSAKRARTIGMVALVGTQLGQTLATGGATRPVMWTCVASGLALGAIVQTPGVSQFFGCTPLGPIGWATAIGATGIATGVAMLLPRFSPLEWRVKVEPDESGAPALGR